MRRFIEQFNDLVSLSPFRSWPDCIINTSGYDYRKGQGYFATQTGEIVRIICVIGATYQQRMLFHRYRCSSKQFLMVRSYAEQRLLPMVALEIGIGTQAG